MYYNDDLLNLKHGKFSAIWILGNSKCDRSKKKELAQSKILAVNVKRMCKDVCDLLPIGGNHISLYLASTLSLGTVKCFCIQVWKLNEDIRNARENQKKKDRQINEELFQVYDGDMAHKDAFRNPLIEIGKRLEESDSLSLSQGLMGREIRGIQRNNNRADPSVITMREDPNVEFGRLELNEDFGFGDDPIERESMGQKMFNGLFLEGPMTAAEQTAIDNENMPPPPPPEAPARKTCADQDNAQSTPINPNVEEMDMDIDLSDINADRLKPYLRPSNPIPFPSAEDSSLLRDEVDQGEYVHQTLLPEALPSLQEEIHNEDIAQEQQDSRIIVQEPRLSVSNVGDEEVPSFQLLTPVIVTARGDNSRKKIKIKKMKDQENRLSKEYMNLRRQDGGCGDIIREKDPKKRMRPKQKFDDYLLQSTRDAKSVHFAKYMTERYTTESRFENENIPSELEGIDLPEENQTVQNIDGSTTEKSHLRDSDAGPIDIDASGMADKTLTILDDRPQLPDNLDLGMDTNFENNLPPIQEEREEISDIAGNSENIIVIDGIEIRETIPPHDQQILAPGDGTIGKVSSEEWSEPSFLKPKVSQNSTTDDAELWSEDTVITKLCTIISQRKLPPSGPVHYNELCESDNCWKRNAARAFQFLLNLDKECAIRLEQENCFDNASLEIYLLDRIYELNDAISSNIQSLENPVEDRSNFQELSHLSSQINLMETRESGSPIELSTRRSIMNIDTNDAISSNIQNLENLIEDQSNFQERSHLNSPINVMEMRASGKRNKYGVSGSPIKLSARRSIINIDTNDTISSNIQNLVEDRSNFQERSLLNSPTNLMETRESGKRNKHGVSGSPIELSTKRSIRNIDTNDAISSNIQNLENLVEDQSNFQERSHLNSPINLMETRESGKRNKYGVSGSPMELSTRRSTRNIDIRETIQTNTHGTMDLSPIYELDDSVSSNIQNLENLVEDRSNVQKLSHLNSPINLKETRESGKRKKYGVSGSPMELSTKRSIRNIDTRETIRTNTQGTMDMSPVNSNARRPRSYSMDTPVYLNEDTKKAKVNTPPRSKVSSVEGSPVRGSGKRNKYGVIGSPIELSTTRSMRNINTRETIRTNTHGTMDMSPANLHARRPTPSSIGTPVCLNEGTKKAKGNTSPRCKVSSMEGGPIRESGKRNEYGVFGSPIELSTRRPMRDIETRETIQTNRHGTMDVSPVNLHARRPRFSTMGTPVNLNTGTKKAEGNTPPRSKVSSMEGSPVNLNFSSPSATNSDN